MDARRDLRWAWLSLLGFIPSFFAAFGVGEGLASLMGFPPGAGAAPAPALWQMAVTTIPALIVFAIPAFIAWHFGRRAVRAGARRGWLPAALGTAIAVGFAALNVVAYLTQRL